MKRKRPLKIRGEDEARREGNGVLVQEGAGLPGWMLPAAAAGLTAASFGVYSRTLGQGFMVLDDPEYVTGNQMVQRGLTGETVKWAFGDVSAANWHPLTWISHMVDWTLYGSAAWGHHLTSVLLHTANVLLVWLVICVLAGRRARWWGLLAAGVFGLHPLRVESVAWVSERKDVLSAFFGLLAIHAYAKYARGRGAGATESTRRLRTAGWYAGCAGWFACSLMSKAMFVTLPFLLLVLDWWPLRRVDWARGRKAVDPLVDREARRVRVAWAVVEKLPLLAMSAAVSMVTYAAQRGEHTVTSLRVISLGRRLANAVVAYATYAGQFVWPRDLAIFYSYPERWPAVTVAASVAVIAAITGVAVWQRRRGFVMTGWMWFAGMLVPVIGLVQVGSQSHADRYMYMPGVGLGIIAAGVAGWLARRSTKWRAGVAAGGCVVLGVLGGLTYAQVRLWDSDERLFRHAIEASEGNYFAHNILARVLAEQGELDEAREHARRSLELNGSYALIADFYGDALIRNGRWEEAAGHFERLLAGRGTIESSAASDAAVAKLYNNWGTAVFNLGRFEDAAAKLRESLRLKPDFAEARVNLGAALAQGGKGGEAVEVLREAVQEYPDDAAAQTNLGHALISQGKAGEALQYYLKALALNPSEGAVRDVVEARAKLGVGRESAAAFERALPTGWDAAGSHKQFGDMLMSARFQQGALAAAHYERVCELRPSEAAAWIDLGKALGAAGRTGEAIKAIERALQIDPGNSLAQELLKLAREDLGAQQGTSGQPK